MIKSKNMAFWGTVAALLANLIFGFSNLFSRLALNHAHPMFILNARFTLAFIVLIVLATAKICKLNLKGKDLKMPILLGTLQPLLYMIFELYGISLTSSAVSGVMISLSPVLVALFAGFFLKEKTSLLQGVFAFFSFIGIALIAFFSTDGKDNFLLGILFLLGAAVTAAAFNILGRKISSDFSPFERTFVTFAVSCIGFNLLTPFILKGDYLPSFERAFSSGEFIIAFLYLSLVSSIGAFLLYNFSVSHISAVRASSFSNIITVVSVLAGVFILNERLSLYQIIGCVIIIIGVFGVNRFKKERN